MGQIFRFILTPFIILSCFFQDILLTIDEKNLKYRNFTKKIIQIIYCLCISFTSGIILSIVAIVGITMKYSAETLGKYTMFYIPSAILIILIWIVVLNYRDFEFSLPLSMFSICWMIINSKFKFRIIESIISVFIMTLTLSVIIFKLLSNYAIPINDAKIIGIVILTGCFFISLIIYSEFTKNEVARMARQFVLWLFIFLGFAILSIYQIYTFVLKEGTQESIVNISIGILGLALTMTTIIDKTRNLYEKVYKECKQEIADSIIIGIKKYSVDRVLIFYFKRKKEVLEVLNTVVYWWKSGRKLKVLKLVIIELFFVLLAVILLKTNFEAKIINNLYKNINENVFSRLHINENILYKIAGLIFISALFIKCVIDLIKNFNRVHIYYRLVHMIRVLFTFLIWIMLIGGMFFNSFNILFRIAVILIFIVIIILIIISIYIEKREKKRGNIQIGRENISEVEKIILRK